MSTHESSSDGPEGEGLSDRIARFNRGMTDGSQHWRELASQAVAKAEEMTNSEAKEVMFKIAEQYERFVKLAERSP